MWEVDDKAERRRRRGGKAEHNTCVLVRYNGGVVVIVVRGGETVVPTLPTHTHTTHMPACTLVRLPALPQPVCLGCRSFFFAQTGFSAPLILFPSRRVAMWSIISLLLI